MLTAAATVSDLNVVFMGSSSIETVPAFPADHFLSNRDTELVCAAKEDPVALILKESLVETGFQAPIRTFHKTIPILHSYGYALETAFLGKQEQPLDLNWLRDFECLARTLNFTRASDERNITQSAFSRRIKALENWVGLPLVNRATYPIQLTEAGEQFLPVALGAISQLSESRQSIRDADRGDRRFIRFSALHTISVNYLASRIEELQRQIIDLRTRVVSDSLSTCCELLVEGAVDVLLCYYHHSVSPMIDETAFVRKDLLTERLIPVAAAEPARLNGWDLANQSGPSVPYLAYERSSFLGMVVENTVDRKPLNAETIYVDGLVETIKRRLMTGSGFAWMPETAISVELAEGALVPIGDDKWGTTLTISALSNPTTLDATARELWDML